MTDEIFGDVLDKNPDSLRIRIAAAADGQFDLYEDDNTTCAYEEGRCAITSMSFQWEKEQGFYMDAVSGETALVPEKRELVLEFWGMTEVPVEVSEAGQVLSCETSYDKEKNVLTVTVPAHVSGEKLAVRFLEKAVSGSNHVEKRIFDFLQQAEISYALKEEIYTAVKAEKNPIILMGNLYAMNIEEKLLGILLEILCADAK